MPRTSDARQKAIRTAERLFRTQGYAATGLMQILEESGAPKGSFYFHFPGGKRELANEVLGAYRDRTAKGFRALSSAAAGDRRLFLRSLADAIADEMAASGWTSGCVAQALAQELAPGDTEIAAALAALFDEWADIIAEAIGTPAAAGRQTALSIVAALEGGRSLARAMRSRAPFDAIAAEFAAA